MGKKKETFTVTAHSGLSRRMQLNTLLLALLDQDKIRFTMSDRRNADFHGWTVKQGELRNRDGAVRTMEFKGSVGFLLGDTMSYATLIVPRDERVDMLLVIGDLIRY